MELKGLIRHKKKAKKKKKKKTFCEYLLEMPCSALLTSAYIFYEEMEKVMPRIFKYSSIPSLLVCNRSKREKKMLQIQWNSHRSATAPSL